MFLDPLLSQPLRQYTLRNF